MRVLSVGHSIELFKDVGRPDDVARRYGFSALRGTHCVGHTRMATESQVSPAHAHPFTAGEDFCLVHNGSLSNPYSLRRLLEEENLEFETDNDTEAACRFLNGGCSQGDTIEQALGTALRRARRLLHASDRHGPPDDPGAGRLRLQAGGRRRDGRLRRDLFGVPLAGAPAGSRRRQHLRAAARGDLFMEGRG